MYACSSSSFAGLLETFDERVFELELADKAQAVGEAVVEEQHEAVEVEDGIAVGAVERRVEVHLHVAGDRSRFGADYPFRAPGRTPTGASAGERQRRERERESCFG